MLVHYAPRESLYLEGDSAQHWFEIRSGVVRTCRFMADGQRQLTGFFFAGDVLGVEQGVRRTSAEAVGEVAVLRRDRRGPLTGHEAGGRPLASVLDQALASAEERILLFGLRTAAERVAAFLLMMARATSQHDVCLPMSRADIADYLGLTVETVSRTFSHFARTSLIELRGPHQFRVRDQARLSRTAGWVDPEPDDGACAGPALAAVSARSPSRAPVLSNRA